MRHYADEEKSLFFFSLLVDRLADAPIEHAIRPRIHASMHPSRWLMVDGRAVYSFLRVSFSFRFAPNRWELDVSAMQTRGGYPLSVYSTEIRRLFLRLASFFFFFFFL